MNNSESITEKLTMMGWEENLNNLFFDKIRTSDFPDKFLKKVNKGIITVSAFGGITGMTLKDRILTIPEGEQCDPVWAYRSETIDASGEFAEDDLRLHKEFSRIFIKTDEFEQGEIILMANGNIAGFDVATFMPHKGRFYCFADSISENEYMIAVPRQTDSSLLLEVYKDSILHNTIKIGELIERSGYSWSKEDLDDIYLSINIFSDTNVSISINGWDTERITYTI